MNSIAPVWEEVFVYKGSEKDLLTQRVLEVTIWDFDKRGSNDFIGGVRIGPARSGSASQGPDWMDSFGDELVHWESVMARPGEWVEQWHTLRPRMDKSISSLPKKPSTPFIRELSPVRESLSLPSEDDKEKKKDDEAVGEQVLRKSRASSVTLGERKLPEAAVAGSHRAQTLPTRDSPTLRPSPLVLSRKREDEKSNHTPELSRSRPSSPIPQVLVTSEPGEQTSHPPSIGIPVSY